MIEQLLEIWPSDSSPYAAMLKIRRSSRILGAVEPVGLIFAEKNMEFTKRSWRDTVDQ